MEAWFVDALDLSGYKNKKDKLFSSSGILSNGGSIIAGLLGAYVGSINLALPFLFGAVSAIATFVVGSLLMVEVRSTSTTVSLWGGISRMREIIKFSVSHGMKNRAVLFLIIPAAITMFSYMALMQYWQPYFQTLSGNTKLLGYVWICFSVGLMVGNLFVQLTVTLKRYMLLMLSIAISAVSLFGMTRFNLFSASLGFFLFYFIGRGIMIPTRKAFINENIPAKSRSTVLSFDSMVCRGTAALGLIVFGFIAKSTSISFSWYIASAVSLLALPFLVLLKKHPHLSKLRPNH